MLVIRARAHLDPSPRELVVAGHSCKKNTNLYNYKIPLLCQKLSINSGSGSPPHPNKKIAPVAAAGVEDWFVTVVRLLGCFRLLPCSALLKCGVKIRIFELVPTTKFHKIVN